MYNIHDRKHLGNNQDRALSEHIFRWPKHRNGLVCWAEKRLVDWISLTGCPTLCYGDLWGPFLESQITNGIEWREHSFFRGSLRSKNPEQYYNEYPQFWLGNHTIPRDWSTPIDLVVFHHRGMLINSHCSESQHSLMALVNRKIDRVPNIDLFLLLPYPFLILKEL